MLINCTCLALDVILISNVALSEVEFDSPDLQHPERPGKETATDRTTR